MGKETLCLSPQIHPPCAKPAFSNCAQWEGAELSGDPGYSHCQPLFFSIEKSTQLLKRILRGFPSSGSRLAIRSRLHVLCRPPGHPLFPLSLVPQDSQGWMLQAGPPLSEENTTSGVCYTIAHSQLKGSVKTPFSHSLQQPAGNGSPVRWSRCLCFRRGPAQIFSPRIQTGRGTETGNAQAEPPGAVC